MRPRVTSRPLQKALPLKFKPEWWKQFKPSDGRDPKFFLYCSEENYGTTPKDMVSGITATMGSGVTWRRDKLGPYLYFDGTVNAYLEFPGLTYIDTNAGISLAAEIEIEPQAFGGGKYLTLACQWGFPTPPYLNDQFIFEMIMDTPNNYRILGYRFGQIGFVNRNNYRYYACPSAGVNETVMISQGPSRTVAPSYEWPALGTFHSKGRGDQSYHDNADFQLTWMPKTPNKPFTIGSIWTAIATRGNVFKGKIRWLGMWNSKLEISTMTKLTNVNGTIWPALVKTEKYRPHIDIPVFASAVVGRKWCVSPALSDLLKRVNRQPFTAYALGVTVWADVSISPRKDLVSQWGSGYYSVTSRLVFKCVQAGTTGPTASANLAVSYTYTDLLTDGTVKWENVTGSSWKYPAENAATACMWLTEGSTILIDKNIERQSLRAVVNGSMSNGIYQTGQYDLLSLPCQGAAINRDAQYTGMRTVVKFVDVYDFTETPVPINTLLTYVPYIVGTGRFYIYAPTDKSHTATLRLALNDGDLILDGSSCYMDYCSGAGQFIALNCNIGAVAGITPLKVPQRALIVGGTINGATKFTTAMSILDMYGVFMNDGTGLNRTQQNTDFQDFVAGASYHSFIGCSINGDLRNTGMSAMYRKSLIRTLDGAGGMLTNKYQVTSLDYTFGYYQRHTPHQYRIGGGCLDGVAGSIRKSPYSKKWNGEDLWMSFINLDSATTISVWVSTAGTRTFRIHYWLDGTSAAPLWTFTYNTRIFSLTASYWDSNGVPLRYTTRPTGVLTQNSGTTETLANWVSVSSEALTSGGVNYAFYQDVTIPDVAIGLVKFDISAYGFMMGPSGQGTIYTDLNIDPLIEVS